MVDKKDMLVLQALKRNAKASIAKISKETGLPGTTVHNRVKKLLQEGVIKGYTIKIDNKKIGKVLSAYVAITVDYMDLKEKNLTVEQLLKKIAKLPFVEEINSVTGVTDLIAKARVKNIDELNQFVMRELRNFDGVEKTQTMVILQEVMD